MIDNELNKIFVQNNELSFYHEATEVRDFFNATSNLEALFQKLKPLYLRQYTQLNMFYEEVILIEKITPLEIAALNGKQEHLSVILASTPISRTPRRTSSLISMQPVEAFFRALNNGHSEIAGILLDLSPVVAGVSEVNIKPEMYVSNAFSEYKSYLEKIQRPSRYRRLNKQLRNNGNVALIMAAQSHDSVIFFRLLGIDACRQQLPKSGVQAFLCATTTPEGATIEKDALPQGIVDCLLECPEVFAFVYSRAFDFGSLLEASMQKRLKQLHDNSIAISNMTESDIIICVYYILYLIEYNPVFASTELEFLLSIQSVQLAFQGQLQLPGDFSLANDGNALLHWAIKHENQGAIDVLLKIIPDIPGVYQKYQVYDHAPSCAHTSRFFKSLAVNTSSRCSDTDLSTLAASTSPNQIDQTGGLSALTVDMNLSMTPIPTID